MPRIGSASIIDSKRFLTSLQVEPDTLNALPLRPSRNNLASVNSTFSEKKREKMSLLNWIRDNTTPAGLVTRVGLSSM